MKILTEFLSKQTETECGDGYNSYFRENINQKFEELRDRIFCEADRFRTPHRTLVNKWHGTYYVINYPFILKLRSYRHFSFIGLDAECWDVDKGDVDDVVDFMQFTQEKGWEEKLIPEENPLKIK